MENTVNRLIDKSIESFLMAIEVYNKPTIHYRIEGFSMFICNAWELLLKAHMMNTQGERSIYYKDNPNRTLSLENCIEKVFTNRKAPLRLNLEKIIELRNTSTHFITEEYEMVYVPLFQSCVFNYTEKLHDFFGIEANKYVPQNFLTLTVSMRPLDVEEIRAKYPPELANRLLQASADIQSLSAEENNAAFAIRIEHYHYITKDKDKATSTIHIDKNAEIEEKEQKLQEVNDSLAQLESSIRQQNIHITDTFGPYLGKEYLNTDKLLGLSKLIQSGTASNITEAIEMDKNGVGKTETN